MVPYNEIVAQKAMILNRKERKGSEIFFLRGLSVPPAPAGT
jgi:hypothetical protein